jgi:ASC-1-like (ASCH) protein
MKNWTLKFRAVDKENFNRLQRGDKAVETRAASVRYLPIAVGDTLTFTCGKDRFTKTIIRRYHWPSIDAMVKEIDFKKIMPSVSSVDEMKKRYAAYPGYEDKIRQNGLLGFEFE